MVCFVLSEVLNVLSGVVMVMLLMFVWICCSDRLLLLKLLKISENEFISEFGLVVNLMGVI